VLINNNNGHFKKRPTRVSARGNDWLGNPQATLAEGQRSNSGVWSVVCRGVSGFGITRQMFIIVAVADHYLKNSLSSTIATGGRAKVRCMKDTSSVTFM
jgi:hypothetical protein